MFTATQAIEWARHASANNHLVTVTTSAIGMGLSILHVEVLKNNTLIGLINYAFCSCPVLF